MTLALALAALRAQQRPQPIPEPKPFVLTDEVCAAVDDTQPEKQA